MGIAHVNWQVRLAATAVLLLTVPLSGCATSTTGSSLMDARAETPASAKTSGYLSAEDLPPHREVMKADQQLKLKQELIAARDRQAGPNKSTRPQRKPEGDPARPPSPQSQVQQ